MSGQLEIEAGGEETGQETVPPVEQGQIPPLGEEPVHRTHASNLVTDYEGLRGGKGRTDGLIPGTPAAADRDKIYDRIRKWKRRHPGEEHPDEKKYPEKFGTDGQLPAIPAAVPNTSSPSGQVDDNPDSLLESARTALVLWRGTDIEPVLEEFIEMLREWKNGKIETQIAAAKLPPELAEKIMAERKPSDRLEKMICTRGGNILAKLLNRTGISAEHQDELFLASALLAIMTKEIRFQKRFDEIVRASKTT